MKVIYINLTSEIYDKLQKQAKIEYRSISKAAAFYISIGLNNSNNQAIAQLDENYEQATPLTAEEKERELLIEKHLHDGGWKEDCDLYSIGYNLDGDKAYKQIWLDLQTKRIHLNIAYKKAQLGRELTIDDLLYVGGWNEHDTNAHKGLHPIFNAQFSNEFIHELITKRQALYKTSKELI